MNYAEAIQWLYDLRFFGAKFGLENTQKLAALAGDPHQRLRFIHVAGTNGKGSTCAMLESMCREAGRRVGLFTSPHLVAFGERIQVNRRPISVADIVRLIAEIQALLPSFPAGAHPTFFEVVTVMALRYFDEQGCELVVWETGLGGRLDATNIVTPLASVITNVQLDHQQWLGDTLARIAFEKAGIIKPDVPVITGADAPEALEVIRNIAAERSAPLTVVAREDAHRPPLDSLELPLLGEHQKLNAAVALATVRALASHISVSEQAIRAGLANVKWPGRLQIVKTTDGPTWILDGAHNPAGAEILRNALAELFPGAKTTLIMAVMRDKDWTAMCQILAPLAGRICLPPAHSERTAAPAELKPACQLANPRAEVLVCASLAEALELVRGDPVVVLTGSLHFVGEALEKLQVISGSAADERGLNEWTLQPKSR
jgi:dihydrofolate synthase/folylpolyglutamate synthase